MDIDTVKVAAVQASPYGPLVKERGIRYAELVVAAARASRRELDPTGHYSRPHVFTLRVNRAQNRSVIFEDGAAQNGQRRDSLAGATRSRSLQSARPSRAGGRA